MAKLELREVTVSYGRRLAVAPFTDTVASGEWVGLVGPNGAGKSSLLRAIAGLVDATGTVDVDGDGVANGPVRDRAARIAYVAQDPIIPDDMTTSEYVLLGRTPYIGYFSNPSAHDREVVAATLERLRLASFADRLLGTMSGGERQRAVLARALAQEAPVLLLDEPTSALDIGHQQQALELVAELRSEQRITVVSAMHDLTLAGTYTDRVVLLAEGEVVSSGSPQEVLTAERLGEVFHVCVTVEVDPDDGAVIVVPRRGFPV
jgi:iron complex transport system ATP-binding protein